VPRELGESEQTHEAQKRNLNINFDNFLKTPASIELLQNELDSEDLRIRQQTEAVYSFLECQMDEENLLHNLKELAHLNAMKADLTSRDAKRTFEIAKDELLLV